MLNKTDIIKMVETNIFRGPERNVPNPEVFERPTRRTHTAEYKRCILEEIEACVKPGEIGAILRREGLYSSHLTSWRRQREKSEFEALKPKKRGRCKFNPPDSLVKKLEQENKRLMKRLKHAELILEIQKKISEITGIPLKTIGKELKDL